MILIYFFRIVFLSFFLSLNLYASDESLFWQEVRSSNDIELLELYKRKYPNGLFVIFADKKIAKLKYNGTNTTKRITPSFFTYGTYRCSDKDSIFKLNRNHSASYKIDSTEYRGIWSSNGIKANSSFKINGRMKIFYIKASNTNNQYIIDEYKYNRAYYYCKANK